MMRDVARMVVMGIERVGSVGKQRACMVRREEQKDKMRLHLQTRKGVMKWFAMGQIQPIMGQQQGVQLYSPYSSDEMNYVEFRINRLGQWANELSLDG